MEYASMPPTNHVVAIAEPDRLADPPLSLTAKVEICIVLLFTGILVCGVIAGIVVICVKMSLTPLEITGVVVAAVLICAACIACPMLGTTGRGCCFW